MIFREKNLERRQGEKL